VATQLDLLILEDQPFDAELMLVELRQAGFEPIWQRVETREGYLAQLHEGLDLILADYALPQFDALRALRLVQERGLDIPFIIVSGHISEEVAVECIKEGAADYLFKDRLARLGPAVIHALQEKELRDQKRRADTELRGYAERLEMLQQLDLELAAQLDLDVLLHSIVSRAVELVGGDWGGLYLYQPAQKTLRLAVAAGLDQPPVGCTLAPGEGLAGKVWQSGKPAAVEDYRAWSGRSSIFDGLDLHAVVAVPIRWGQRFLGVLDIGADAVRTFSAADIQLLSRIAAQAAIAIENARLYQAERQQRQLAEALREAARALGTSLEPAEILRLILEQLQRVLVCDSASVIVLRDDGTVDLLAGVDYIDEQMTSREARHLLQDSPILRRMALDLQPVVCADVRQLEGWIWVPGAEHVRSWLGIPLVVHERMIGALMADHAQPGFFGEAELAIAQTLAQHAAQAVENAGLYAEARRRSRELALLNRVIAASAAGQEIEPVLRIVCQELVKVFDPSQSAAVLLTEERDAAVVVAECQSDEVPSMVGQVISVAGNPVAQHLLEVRAPLIIGDAQADPRLASVRDLLRQRKIVSLLLLPLLIGDQVVGGLLLGAIESSCLSAAPLQTPPDSSRPCFSGEEVDLARRVAEEVSGALARVRLAEAQRRLSVAVAQAAEAIIVTDPSGIVLYVNPAFERITGYSRAHILGFDPASKSEWAAMYTAVLQAMRAGQVWQGRVADTRPDGSAYTVDMIVAPVRNQAGEMVNFVATLRDVTHEVELEKQFQQMQKMEALGRLAGGVAHDFNNLLTVIFLNTQLLQRRLHPEDPLWEHVREIGETTERAANLTGQLLRFSRREVIEPELLNLNNVIGDLLPMLQRVVTETVSLQTVLAQDLWLIEAHPTQMEQVIINLAVNARDAMGAGGALTIATSNVYLDAEYTARHVDVQQGEHVLLSVSDTGQGMDEEVQARIFEPFFTTKERRRGTGLGLAIVFGIVKQNHGHIQVHSQVGNGTVFEIYLPRATQAQSTPPGAARQVVPIANKLIQGTETVLLVEDEIALRNWMERVLESCGYQVLAVGDGLEALELGRQRLEPIHLLLTDVVLPRMSGRELAEQLRPQRPEMRVLFMSGYTDDEISHHGGLAAGVSFLSKPFTLDELARRIRAVLDNSMQT
jgi:PAS domain S-box-containing protein